MKFCYVVSRKEGDDVEPIAVFRRLKPALKYVKRHGMEPETARQDNAYQGLLEQGWVVDFVPVKVVDQATKTAMVRAKLSIGKAILKE
nr:hypothetical protein [Limosilactobacillus mucosae]